MNDNSTVTLVQNRVWRKNNRLTFVDNRTLRVDQENNNKTSSYRIDIIALRTKHHRNLSLSWPWLLASLFLICLLFAEMQWQFIFPAGSLLATLGYIAIGVLALICFGLFLKFSHIKHVFRSRHAKVPLIEIWAGTPSRKAVNNFLKLMVERIEKAHNHMNLSEEQQLTGEIKMLRRLVDEKVLPQSIYEKAKEKLFKKF